MDKESLIRARNILIDTMNKDNKINSRDKAELIMLLWLLLDEDNYQHDIDVLQKYSKIYERNRNKKFTKTH